jgi:hypothetical protein
LPLMGAGSVGADLSLAGSAAASGARTSSVTASQLR